MTLVACAQQLRVVRCACSLQDDRMGAGDTPEKTLENAAAGLRQQIKYAPDDVSVQHSWQGACAWHCKTTVQHVGVPADGLLCCAVPCHAVLLAAARHHC